MNKSPPGSRNERWREASETELLPTAFANCANAAGLPVSSAITIIDTLHPIWEGRVFLWRNDGVEEEPTFEYGSTRQGEAAERWKRSAFYHFWRPAETRCAGASASANPRTFRLDEFHEQGRHTDY